MTLVAIGSFGAQRNWATPGSEVVVAAELTAAQPVDATAAFCLIDGDRVVQEERLGLRATSQPQTVSVTLALPPAPRHGYGLRLRVESDGATATAHSAIEALDGWWQSPRMAAVTEYDDPTSSAKRVVGLLGWHVNVMQHYDWMWRHYRYTPPDGAAVFVDALGRTVSHDAVRSSIDAGHAVGIASLAYGSVYGAEREHVEAHPDDRVFDEDGRVLSLGETFFINDLRPGTAWRRRLLAGYAGAVLDFGFDGIHMDTYGPPHSAVATDGEAFDFADVYPGLIDEATEGLTKARPGTRVTFNCVDGYPLDAVAPAAAACLYLELWGPDRTFSRVLRWIERARALADGRHVVIAAYAAALGEPARTEQRDGGIEAIVLLGTIIAAAGAYHHVLAEGDRLLVEGYYPAAVSMSAREANELKALWRFGARHVHLLSAPDLQPELADDVRLLDADGEEVEVSAQPEAGTVWVAIRRAADGDPRLHLVDLRRQEAADWDEVRQLSSTCRGLQLEWPAAHRFVAASPWSRGGDFERLEPAVGPPERWRLPDFDRWLMVVPSRSSDDAGSGAH